MYNVPGRPTTRLHLVVQLDATTWLYPEPPTSSFSIIHELLESEYAKRVLAAYPDKTIAIMSTNFIRYMQVAKPLDKPTNLCYTSDERKEALSEGVSNERTEQNL